MKDDEMIAREIMKKITLAPRDIKFVEGVVEISHALHETAEPLEKQTAELTREVTALTAEEEANIMNKMMMRFFRPFIIKLITKEDVELLRELEAGEKKEV